MSVVLTAFVFQFFTLGILFSSGLFVPVLTATFSASIAQISIIGSVQFGMFYVGGISAGVLSHSLGPRKTALLGTTLWSVGLFTSTVVTSYEAMIGTMSVVNGLGSGTGYFITLMVIPQVLPEGRQQSLGIAFSMLGSGLSQLLFSFVMVSYLDQWQATLRIFGIIGTVMMCITSFLLPTEAIPSVSTSANLLRDSSVRIILVGTFFLQFVFFIPFEHLVTYAMDHGDSYTSASQLQGFLAAGSILGRIFSPVIGLKFGSVRTLRVIYLLTCITSFLWILCNDPTKIIILSVSLGYLTGSILALNTIVIVDILDHQDFSKMLGFFIVCTIPGAISGGYIAGAMRDAFGNYDSTIFLSGSVYAVCFLLMMGLRTTRLRKANMIVQQVV